MSKFKVGDRVRLLPLDKRVVKPDLDKQAKFFEGEEFVVTGTDWLFGGYVVGAGNYGGGVYDGNIELVNTPVTDGAATLTVDSSEFKFDSLEELYETLTVLYARADNYQRFIIEKGE